MLSVLTLTACSTDDTTFDQQHEAIGIEDATGYSSHKDIIIPEGIGPCFKRLTGGISIDLPNGLNNPILIFSAQPGALAPPSSKYRLKVELQPLQDCEDMGTAQGPSLVYTAPVIFINISVSTPTVSLVPSQLPNTCYRWRMILEEVITGQRDPGCRSFSPWYEEPLY